MDIAEQNAIVIMADIANYETGAARCTGGAGAIAMLIGPNAPLVCTRSERVTHMEDTSDFYKPYHGKITEYPRFNSDQTLDCYLRGLEKCLHAFIRQSRSRSREGT